jgi:hypothetical protein
MRAGSSDFGGAGEEGVRDVLGERGGYVSALETKYHRNQTLSRIMAELL